MLRLVMNLVSFPYKMAFANTAETVSEIRNGSEGEKKTSHRVFNSMALFPMVMAIGVFLYAIISFIAGSGFANEISMLKSEGISAISDIWTSGTAGYFYNIWFCIPVAAVLMALAGMAVIRFYKKATVAKKTVFTILLVLVNLGAAVAGFAMISEVGFADAFRMIGIDSNTSLIIALVMSGVAVISSIVCTVMLSGEGAFIRGFVSTVFFFTVAPLTCLVIENLIGLVVFAVVLVVMWVAGTILGTSIAPTPKSEAQLQAEDNMRRAKKEQQKKSDRIAALENQIDGYGKTLDKHYKGEFLIDTVDTKYVHKKMLEAQAEIESLKS